MYYVHISAVPLTFSFVLSLSSLSITYKYVQASRMRVSEAYTELEPTFAYEKLESNIILNDYFNISNGQQQRKLVSCCMDTSINTFLNHAI